MELVNTVITWTESLDEGLMICTSVILLHY